jgi:hypothetical protein
MCYRGTLLVLHGDAVTAVMRRRGGRCRWPGRRRGRTDDSTLRKLQRPIDIWNPQSELALPRRLRDRAEITRGRPGRPIAAEGAAPPGAQHRPIDATRSAKAAGSLRGRRRRESRTLGRVEAPRAIGMTTDQCRGIDGLSADINGLRHRLTRHAQALDDDRAGRHRSRY